MNLSAATPLIDTLREPVLRMRTGVLLLEETLLGKEPEIAARLGITSVDLCSWMLLKVKPRQHFLGMTWKKLLENLSAIAEDRTVGADCLLVVNIDVPLAAVPYVDRSHFWRFLHSNFRPPRAMVFTMPREALHLFTSADREWWQRDERLATCQSDR